MTSFLSFVWGVQLGLGFGAYGKKDFRAVFVIFRLEDVLCHYCFLTEDWAFPLASTSGLWGKTNFLTVSFRA